jgi:CheY-like chemotaxis protein
MPDREVFDQPDTSASDMPFKTGAQRHAAEVLLVEDNPADVRLMQEAFREAGGHVRLHVARNGLQALAFLQREAPYTASPRPALVLLDLNLPGADGSELLAEIKKDRALRQIPVIVLSTSTRSEDIARAYDLHANCYVSKPCDLASLVEAVRLIEAFWLRTAAFSSDKAKSLASRKSA